MADDEEAVHNTHVYNGAWGGAPAEVEFGACILAVKSDVM